MAKKLFSPDMANNNSDGKKFVTFFVPFANSLRSGST